MKMMAYEITENIATIASYKKGAVTVELNKVSFNGGPSKLDIRTWEKWGDGTKGLGKGIRLNDDEAQELMYALQDYFARFGGGENE